ncbi:hypothetical protein [Streptomyces netropsis]|uniref:Uncharacterized protein n=1 Tax=Streptomyces netropsis TaxID=55404 RepID=A0A7W7LIK0_STRNE|nr:hypothetical protein [Streptomyces netropsis]MBB4890905.1 hypothetical protein [Streptomyces netropsis]GGR53166.1 hypothetical protein GCM10010219_67720 [Streptomyces netropsis]
MSDSEVPRQNTPVDDFGQLAFPPMPPRWDAPPTAISEPDLMRMTPGGTKDELLDTISDALWEPVDLHEPASVHAERLKSITEDGAKLREKWAETAALEEAYAAPSTTLRERRQAAQERKIELMQARLRRRRHQRLLWLVLVLAGMAGAVVMAFLASGRDWLNIPGAIGVLLISQQLARMIADLRDCRAAGGGRVKVMKRPK